MFFFIKNKGLDEIEIVYNPVLKVFKIVVNPKYFSIYPMIASGGDNANQMLSGTDHIYHVCLIKYSFGFRLFKFAEPIT
jgi:hypothetical protein